MGRDHKEIVYYLQSKLNRLFVSCRLRCVCFSLVEMGWHGWFEFSDLILHIDVYSTCIHVFLGLILWRGIQLHVRYNLESLIPLNVTYFWVVLCMNTVCRVISAWLYVRSVCCWFVPHFQGFSFSFHSWFCLGPVIQPHVWPVPQSMLKQLLRESLLFSTNCPKHINPTFQLPVFPFLPNFDFFFFFFYFIFRDIVFGPPGRSKAAFLFYFGNLFFWGYPVYFFRVSTSCMHSRKLPEMARHSGWWHIIYRAIPVISPGF